MKLPLPPMIPPMFRKSKWIAWLFAGLLVSSCDKDYQALMRDEVWVPVYLEQAQAQVIESQEPRAPKVGGKIYAWQDYLFQLEPNLGIHVYQLVDQKPQPRQFIQVYGAQEISIRDAYLYTNNHNDVVSLAIADLGAVKEVGRVKNVFTLNHGALPPERGYFECVDPERGIVIGWEKKNNKRVKCKY